MTLPHSSSFFFLFLVFLIFLSFRPFFLVLQLFDLSLPPFNHPPSPCSLEGGDLPCKRTRRHFEPATSISLSNKTTGKVSPEGRNEIFKKRTKNNRELENQWLKTRTAVTSTTKVLKHTSITA